ncbi:PEP-CTERM sorting domain-containing protein [uncultured Psychromonas sp.]|uniref:PEP-CTERM sorting domain-containing protein n=1 Tax=uncultured Psychromonas sp. TaxID=173974 RepID=UPI00263914D7|nr:PEP-CTERM sorting domain-containing protein [uncultured Psychromonas sp.]
MDMFNFSNIKKMGLAIGLLFSASTFAGTIVDTVEQNQFVGWLDSHTYQHNLNDGLDQTGSFTLGSAFSGFLEVEVTDDKDGFFEGIFPEVMLFTVEDFDFDSGAITFNNGFSGALEVNALGALNADGLLDIVVSSLLGDFYVGKSTLTVQVPAPETMLLFGLAIAGLAVRRQRQLQK